MKINIDEIYKKNIYIKYNYKNREEFEKAFTPLQREMWNFTLLLLKDNFPETVYDSLNVSDYLDGYHKLYIDDQRVIKFTLDQWFEYLDSMK